MSETVSAHTGSEAFIARSKSSKNESLLGRVPLVGVLNAIVPTDGHRSRNSSPYPGTFTRGYLSFTHSNTSITDLRDLDYIDFLYQWITVLSYKSTMVRSEVNLTCSA